MTKLDNKTEKCVVPVLREEARGLTTQSVS